MVSNVTKQRSFAISTIIILFALFLSLFFTKSIIHAEKGDFAEGDGSADAPFLIETAEQLDLVRENLTAHYKITADIDLFGYENWEPIGQRGAAFQGTFDGDGHTIKNLKIDSSQGNNQTGLFGYVLSTKEVTPVIKNVHLQNIMISTGDNIGGLIGFIDTQLYENEEGDMVHPNPTIVSGIIASGQVHQGAASNGGTNGMGLLIGKAINVNVANAEVTGYVRGAYRIGGLIGFAPRKTHIKNSSFSGDVDGTTYYIGGLVGRLGTGASVIGSSTEGTVLGRSIIGGITGYMGNGIISESYSTSYVEATEGQVGGLVGVFDPNTSDPLTITKSFATGDVRGTSSVGGLIGNTYHLSRAVIENTFATGNVSGTGSWVGGLIGFNDNGSLKNSYSIGRVTTDEGTTPGGLVGSTGNVSNVSASFYNEDTSGQNDEGKGSPKSDTAMKDQDTFDGWDFDHIWHINPNSEYPYPTFDFTSHVPEFSHQDDVVYVKEGALGKGDSWDSPLGNLEIALLIAERDENIKEIWVAEGTYIPTRKPIAPNGNLLTRNEFRHFHMVNDVTIYGGFPASGNPGLMDRDPKTYDTILSGDLYRNDDGSESSKADNVHHVFYHQADSAIDETAILDGVTISGGRATGLSGGHNYGGGMYNDQASPTLRNVVFTDNHANIRGGAMYHTNSSPSLDHVTFKNNTANDGAGIYNLNSSPTITKTEFVDNKANNGGGFYNASSNADPILTDVVFMGNEASTGGAFYNASGSSFLKNVIFEDNVAGTGGGFISYPAGESSGASLQNVLFTGNQANNSGGAILLNGKGVYDFKNLTVTDNVAEEGSGLYVTSYNGKNNIPEVTLQNSILWDNDNENLVNNDNVNPIMSNSLIGGSGGSENWNEALGVDGGNNLDEDPLFMGNGDYTLQEGSPAIDAGNNDYILDGVTTDLSGNDRIVNGTVDLGAYEYSVEQPELEKITVKPKEITLQLNGEDLPFEVVSEFDLEGLEVIAHYSDGDTDVVTDDLGFEVENDSIVEMSDGNLHARAEGETTLTINHDDQEAEVQIKVIAAPKLTEIELMSSKELFLHAGQRTSLSNYSSTVVAHYENAPENEGTVVLDVDDLRFTSSDSTIAEIDEGDIVGVHPGETEIIVSYGGKEAEIEVFIANKLYFTDDEDEVGIGESIKPTLILLTPDGEQDIAHDEVTYFSHDKDIVIVDEEGNITGKELGITKVTATLTDDIGITTEIFIWVTKAEKVDSTAMEISFPNVSITLEEGSVKEETIIKVRPVTEEEKTERKPKEWEGRDFASSVYRFSKSKADELDDPTELSYFEKPITLTFDFNHKEFTENTHNVAIYWYDEKNEQWIELTDTIVDWESGQVSGTIDHFTLFTVLAMKKADKDDLRERIEEAEEYDSNSHLYTEDSYAMLMEMLDTAKETFNQEGATQEEVDIALKNLETAIDALIKVVQVNKDELLDLIETARDLEEDDYTSESYGKLQDAIRIAEELLEDTNVTQTEVNEQANLLRKAIANLVLVEDPIEGDVDKSALANLLIVAKSYQEDNYTGISFGNLKEKINEAEYALENDVLNQKEINTVLDNLQTAINDLETYEVEIEFEIEEIEFESIKRKDDTLEEGKRIVIQEGKKGQKIITYEIPYINGERGEGIKISEKIIKPIHEIIAIGTKKADPDPEDPPIDIPDPNDKDPDPQEPEPRVVKVKIGEEYEVNANDVVTIQINGTNTTIIMPDNLPAGTKVSVQDAKERTEAIEAAQLVIAGDVFDISIFDTNNEQVHGPFVVTMGYDQDHYNADEVAIYYYDEDQNMWIKLKGTVNEDEGTITTEVDHFSMYGVFSESVAPTTGDQSSHVDQDSSSKDKGSSPEPKDLDGNRDVVLKDHETEADHTLPKTTTNIFNMIAIGLILLVIGGISLIFLRKRIL